MIDEDRTYENEVRFNNDRLGVKKNRKDNKNFTKKNLLLQKYI